MRTQQQQTVLLWIYLTGILNKLKGKKKKKKHPYFHFISKQSEQGTPYRTCKGSKEHLIAL